MTVSTRFAAVLGFTLAAGLATSAAIAAPAEIGRNTTKIADAVQVQAAAITDDEDSATCSRSRKRLWVEGEGWIVRRVTICR